MTVKSSNALSKISRASWIVASVLKRIEPHIQPGISTYELDKLCEEMIVSYGAVPSFKGYNGFSGSICASVNEVVVHGIPNKDTILKKGDIITVDVGANVDGYHGDGAWTFGVGEISHEAQRLMDVTKSALEVGLTHVKAGARIGDISSAIGAHIKAHGYSVPLEFGGHGIGKDLHEDPMIFNDGKAGRGMILKENMTLCIEPIVHAGRPLSKVLQDQWTTTTVDGSWSAHFEHTVLVTKGGCSILTTI